MRPQFLQGRWDVQHLSHGEDEKTTFNWGLVKRWQMQNTEEITLFFIGTAFGIQTLIFPRIIQTTEVQYLYSVRLIFV